MTVAPTLALLAGPLLAGVVGSPHCVGMCGGFSVAASAAGGRRGALGALAWSAGRLTTYAVLGALAGAFGQLLPGPGWVGTAVAAALLVFFAARLAGLRPARGAAPAWLVRASARVAGRADLPGRYLFGVLTGLLPCGLVYAALAFPTASAEPLLGAATMVAFGLGTVPALALAGVGLRRLVARSLWARRGLALAVLLFGMGGLMSRSAPSRAAFEPVEAPLASTAATAPQDGAQPEAPQPPCH